MRRQRQKRSVDSAEVRERFAGESQEFRAGHDAGLHGANSKNCHFSMFDSNEKAREWERGKVVAESEKSRG